jgi:hypothetical protein
MNWILFSFVITSMLACSSAEQNHPVDEKEVEKPGQVDVVTSQAKTPQASEPQNVPTETDIETSDVTTDSELETSSTNTTTEESSTQLVDLQANTVSGAIDSSGGNLSASTEAQVRFYLKPSFLKKFLLETTYRLEVSGIKNEVLQPLILGNSVMPTPLIIFVENLDLNSMESDQCVDSVTGLGRDASVSKTGDFCFDVKRMMRIPKQALHIEIVALMMHEISHIYGFNEEHAEQVQQSIRRYAHILFPDIRAIDTIAADVIMIRNDISDVMIGLGKDMEKSEVCAYLGSAEGAAKSWRYLTMNNLSGGVNDDGEFHVLDAPLYVPFAGLLGELASSLSHIARRYCKFAADQEQIELIKSLEESYSLVNQILIRMPEFLGRDSDFSIFISPFSRFESYQDAIEEFMPIEDGKVSCTIEVENGSDKFATSFHMNGEQLEFALPGIEDILGTALTFNLELDPLEKSYEVRIHSGWSRNPIFVAKSLHAKRLDKNYFYLNLDNRLLSHAMLAGAFYSEKGKAEFKVECDVATGVSHPTQPIVAL